MKNKQTTTSRNRAIEELRKLKAKEEELLFKKKESKKLLIKAEQLSAEKGIGGDDR